MVNQLASSEAKSISRLVIGVVVVGILIRFLYLNADPYYYEWSGYITDEGRWVQAARSFALSHFGSRCENHKYLKARRACERPGCPVSPNRTCFAHPLFQDLLKLNLIPNRYAIEPDLRNRRL